MKPVHETLGDAKDAAELLNELIEVTRDGERFYMDAADKVEAPELKAVFEEMAAVRQSLIDDLGDNVIVRGGKPSGNRTLTGTARKFYADALASFAANEPVYVAGLEEAEDRLLQHYRRALETCPSESVRGVLAQHLPTVEAAHGRMQRLKQRYLKRG